MSRLIKRKLTSKLTSKVTGLLRGQRKKDDLGRKLFSTAAKGMVANKTNNNWHFGAISVATAALMIASTQQENRTASCDSTAAEGRQDAASGTRGPRKLSKLAKTNVMLHSRRSLRARTLDDKYNVDWDVVIGEGAYGSVHPGRLAATGEKVCSCTIVRSSLDLFGVLENLVIHTNLNMFIFEFHESG